MRRTPCLLLGIAAALTPHAASAGKLTRARQYEDNLARPAEETVRRAAGFLLERQGAWPSGEGRIVLDGWEWLVGTGQGAPNIAGLVALGLVDAYEATNEERFLDSARQRGRLAHRQLASGEHVYAPDVELVARLAKLDGDDETLALARRGLEARIERAGGPEGEVQRIIGLRRATPDLAGYDVAMLADAALSVDRADLARRMLHATLAAGKRWLKDDSSTFGLISTGALLATASRLRDDHARSLAVSLLAAQQPDGAWRTRETQATSYATRGLALFARAFKDSTAAKAAQRGRDWLRLTQLRSGAWADYNDYLPEPWVGEVFSPATAEALRAVVAVR